MHSSLVFIFSFQTFFTITWGQSDLKLHISPVGHLVENGPPILVQKVDDSLNLTCRLINKNNDILPNYNISWNWQYSQKNNFNRVMLVSLSHNEANLVFKALKETDSGEYTCKCIELNLYEHIRVKVKAFKRTCSDKMFVCPNGNCIGRNFVCDGKHDCKYGTDEDPEYCGVNPCQGKIPCDNGRCIPASWCCDEIHDPNCTIKVKPKCCQQLVRSYSDIDSTEFVDHRFGDMGFLQTTIYTVIGCAMAFMFIVTILVIAICRVHLKRTVISRCPLNHQHHPGSPIHTGLPIYDIDMFLDRQQDHNGGLLVTYNINNGVQFVGRPIDPPPYCEIIDAPPREGPPPPYVSRENISDPPNQPEETPPPETNNETTTNIPKSPGNSLQSVGDENDLDQAAAVSTSRQVVTNLNLTGLLSNKIKTNISVIENCNSANNLTNLKPVTTSSLGELSKFHSDNNSVINSYEICNSVPSVSGLNNKIKNKNIKKNVLHDFSDSDTDSSYSYMENDGLLTNQIRKTGENLEEIKSRSENSSNSSFINNIAAVSKSLIESLSKKQLNNNVETSNNSDVKLKNEKLAKKSIRKNFRPLLTQKSFDSSDRTRKDLVVTNFDKIVPNCTHSMGDLSPVNSDLNYSDFTDQRDFLTLPLRESHIGVRNDEN